MPRCFEHYCEFVECENSEQAKWLAERFAEDAGFIGKVTTEGTTVTVLGLGSDLFSNFDPVVKAVADYQRRFDITAPWVGSYICMWDKPSERRSICGTVVVYRGEEHWTNASELAEEEARDLASSDGGK